MKRITSDNRILASITLVAVPLFVIFSIYFFTTLEKAEVLEDNFATISQVKVYKNPYKTIGIEADAAIVKDLNTGEVIYSKNANTSLPLASITKVMTALVSYQLANPDQSVLITFDSKEVEGEDSLMLGESFGFKDLIDLFLVSSSNDGAAAVSLAVGGSQDNFVNHMNRMASVIGMTNTVFSNETGLDIDESNAGAYGSANDVALMFEYVLKNYPEVLEHTKDVNLSTWSQNGFVHNVTNTNEIIPVLNNLIASKTGYTDIAGGNLAVVVDPGLNRPIAIVVLGSSQYGRFNDVLKLTESISDYFEWLNNK